MSRCCPLGGYCEAKRRSCPELGFHPDRASQSFNNFFAQGQTDACARDFPSMHTRQKSEYTAMMLLVNADAIVADSYDPVRSDPLRRNVNFDCCLTSILHRVADQVLEKPNQIAFPALHCGQRLDRYGSPARIEGLLRFCIASAAACPSSTGRSEIVRRGSLKSCATV